MTMPNLGYFGKLAGATILGLATLVAAIVIAFLLLPYMIPLFSAALPFLTGIALALIAVLVIWALLYVSAMIGVIIIYLFRPMKVVKEGKGYSISGAKEAGMREKKDTEKKDQ